MPMLVLKTSLSEYFENKALNGTSIFLLNTQKIQLIASRQTCGDTESPHKVAQPKSIAKVAINRGTRSHSPKVLRRVATSRWKRLIVVNSMQAKAFRRNDFVQLGDKTRYSDERRRRSVVVAS